MFSRWREGNFFYSMRAHFALDAIDSYAKINEDPERLVANPALRAVDKELAAARRSLAAAEAKQGTAAFSGRPVGAMLRRAFSDATAEVDRLADAAKAFPARVPLAEARPEMVRLAHECKRIMDAIAMATYNAESALARLLAPHYARADDEARTLLREMFGAPADLWSKVTSSTPPEPASRPRRTHAMEALCADFASTRTRYPRTELTLVYLVNPPDDSEGTVVPCKEVWSPWILRLNSACSYHSMFGFSLNGRAASRHRWPGSRRPPAARPERASRTGPSSG